MRFLFIPLLSPGSMSCYCKLNQGEVCGFPVFPHSDVWGQTGSIYRVCPRFFKESPRPASCNQAAEAYVSGQERWMNSGCSTESSAKTKTDRQFFLFEVGAEKEVLWKENSGRQTCCVSLVNNQCYIWYAWYKNVWIKQVARRLFSFYSPEIPWLFNVYVKKCWMTLSVRLLINYIKQIAKNRRVQLSVHRELSHVQENH